MGSLARQSAQRGATRGSMPEAAAAPLPRAGEVFFDVRGSSRTMRLSWYADTGVAVFSIWQGGKCAATFRLPLSDLPRMVETLRRGPGEPAAASGRARLQAETTRLGGTVRTGQYLMPIQP